MKKKMFLGLCIAAGVIFARYNLHAQGRPGMGGPGVKSEVNAAMMRMFGKNNAFNAQCEVKTETGGQKIAMTMNMSVLEGKMRSEIDMAAIKGMQMPPQAIAQMKQMGMDKMVSVTRPDLNKMYMLYPGLKSYVEMALPKEEADAARQEAKIEKTELGKETIDGHPCVKNKVVTESGGKKHEITTWNATDLKDFPIKMTMEDGGAEIMFKDVKFSKPDAKEFEPPAGFEKYENMMQMMQKAMSGLGRPPGAPPAP